MRQLLSILPTVPHWAKRPTVVSNPQQLLGKTCCLWSESSIFDIHSMTTETDQQSLCRVVKELLTMQQPCNFIFSQEYLLLARNSLPTSSCYSNSQCISHIWYCFCIHYWNFVPKSDSSDVHCLVIVLWPHKRAFLYSSMVFQRAKSSFFY